ncbi:MAG: DUF3105 domain-containing protein [Polyangiaceae bacterium]
MIPSFLLRAPAKVCSAIACVLLLSACGDDGAGGMGGGSGGSPAGGAGGAANEPIVTELTPDAPPLPGFSECTVTITENLPEEGKTHVPVCTHVDYGTNPPSSGNHWPVWAAFKTYVDPVPREMLVHDLEHGAVVLAYDCDGCTDVPQAFQDAATTYGVDALCATSAMGAERSRIVITPDPLLDLPIGISAWRATYVATCIDRPSIDAFIEAHYGDGPERTCFEGKDPSDPSTGVPDCSN